MSRPVQNLTRASPSRARQRKHARRGLTNREIILRAAVKLRPPFTVDQLTVAAHEENRDRFCLVGFPQYPNNNLVSAAVYGSKGLVLCGMLAEAGYKLYEVTPKGRASVLEENPARVTPEKVAYILANFRENVTGLAALIGKEIGVCGGTVRSIYRREKAERGDE